VLLNNLFVSQYDLMCPAIVLYLLAIRTRRPGRWIGQALNLDDARHVGHYHPLNDVTHPLPFLSHFDQLVDLVYHQAAAVYEDWL